MSYIKERIAKNLETDPEYRAAYEEEAELLKLAKARRQEVMKRLASLRKAHHLTQEQLAEKMRVSQERVSQMERGLETLSLDKLLDMTAALGLRMVIVEEEDVHRHGLENMVVY